MGMDQQKLWTTLNYKVRPPSYTLVNLQFAMENHILLMGKLTKINYFYGHFH